LSGYELSPVATWRIASGIALLLNWLALAAVIRLGRSSGLHSADRWFTWIGYPLEVVVELPLLMNLFAVLTELAAALYLTSLMAVLCQTAAAFVILVSTLLRSNTGR
jgi:hypothetical protein